MTRLDCDVLNHVSVAEKSAPSSPEQPPSTGAPSGLKTADSTGSNDKNAGSTGSNAKKADSTGGDGKNADSTGGDGKIADESDDDEPMDYDAPDGGFVLKYACSVVVS